MKRRRATGGRLHQRNARVGVARRNWRFSNSLAWGGRGNPRLDRSANYFRAACSTRAGQVSFPGECPRSQRDRQSTVSNTSQPFPFQTERTIAAHKQLPSRRGGVHRKRGNKSCSCRDSRKSRFLRSSCRRLRPRLSCGPRAENFSLNPDVDSNPPGRGASSTKSM